MNIKELFKHERWVPFDKSTRPYVEAHNGGLDRIEVKVTERIKELEASVEGYDRLLDKAYDDFQECADNWEAREVLKELIEYAPRKNWEEK